VEENDDYHDLTDRDLPFPQAFPGAILELHLLPHRDKDLAKIIDIAE
jgi:hypothetical protein